MLKPASSQSALINSFNTIKFQKNFSTSQPAVTVKTTGSTFCAPNLNFALKNVYT